MCQVLSNKIRTYCTLTQSHLWIYWNYWWHLHVHLVFAPLPAVYDVIKMDFTAFS